MKRFLFILLISLLAIPCFSQTWENDSLNLGTHKRTLGGSSLRDRYPSLRDRNHLDEQPSLGRGSTPISDAPKKADSLTMNMRIYVPEFYQGPMYNYLSESKFPYANDYAYYAGYLLSDRSWLTTSSTYDTYVLMGAASNVGGTYHYLLADNLTLSAGAYMSKYVIGLETYNDMGVNAGLKYQITDRIAIHGFGQYSGFANKHKFDSSFSPWAYPQTNFGGAFEYKVTDRFGIMGGMERQLNPMTGKWRNVPFIMPVFYGK